MKIYIPNCGDAVVLDKDWSFDLNPEYRNHSFGKTQCVMPPDDWMFGKMGNMPVKLPTGTELVIDRVYIRQDAAQHSSITFIVKNSTNLEMIGERFWTHLEDANNIECTFVSKDNPVGGFAKARYKAEVKLRTDQKYADAAAARKKKAAALERAKKACADLFTKQNMSTDAAKLLDMIHDDQKNRIIATYGSLTWVPAKENIRESISCCWDPKFKSWGTHCGWAVTSSKTLPNGNVERNIDIRYDGTAFTGFTITSDPDGIVIDIKPLVP